VRRIRRAPSGLLLHAPKGTFRAKPTGSSEIGRTVKARRGRADIPPVSLPRPPVRPEGGTVHRPRRAVALLALLVVLVLGACGPPARYAGAGGTRGGTGPTGTVVPDGTATRGAALEIDAYRGTVAAGAGTFMLEARVKGAGAVALEVGGEPVGRFATSADWRTLSVPVLVPEPGTPFGVRVERGSAQLDWVRLVESAPQLTVRGTEVLGLDGEPVTFRGVQRSGLSSKAWHFNWNDADFARMAQWGAGIVRIEMSHAFWLTSSCAYTPDYRDRIDLAVESLTSRGVVALLDLHKPTEGSTCKKPLLYKMADDRSIQFWREVAGRYKDNPLVAFDLYNEPNAITDAVWRDGGLVDGWAAVGMQALYDAVRSTGATNLVFVSGQRWATDPRIHLTAPLDGYGIVVGAHAYCLECGGALPATLAWAEETSARHPVVITEFGWNVDSSTFNRDLIAWAESRGLGWIAYSWNAGTPEGFSLLADWATYTPSALGRPVHDALQAARAARP
jgi:hypothetical protein